MLIKDSMSVSLKHQKINLSKSLFSMLYKKEKDISTKRLKSNCEIRPCCSNMN